MSSPLWAGLRRSWREHGLTMVLVWMVSGGLCVWAFLARGQYFFDDFRAGGGGPWAGAITVLSAFSLVFAGCSLLLTSRLLRRREGWTSATTGWTIAGVGGLVLAIDEMCQVHEGIARRLERMGLPAPFGIGDYDLYVFGTYGLCAAFSLWRIWPQLRRWSDTWLPGIAATALLLMSSVVDAVPWDRLAPFQQAVLGPLEETFKTIGTVSLAMFALLLFESASRENAPAEAAGRAMHHAEKLEPDERLG